MHLDMLVCLHLRVCVRACAPFFFKALMATFHCGHLASSDNVTGSLKLSSSAGRHTRVTQTCEDTRHEKEGPTDGDGHLSSVHCVPSMDFTSVNAVVIKAKRLINMSVGRAHHSFI